MAYSPDDIPKCLKHMALAIFRGPVMRDLSGSVSSGAIAKFQRSFDAARSRLTQYGYLANGSQSGPPSKIKLTPKGKNLEMEHAKEGFRGSAKERAFDTLFRLLYPSPTPQEKALGKAQPVDHETKKTVKSAPPTKQGKTKARDEF